MIYGLGVNEIIAQAHIYRLYFVLLSRSLIDKPLTHYVIWICASLSDCLFIHRSYACVFFTHKLIGIYEAYSGRKNVELGLQDEVETWIESEDQQEEGSQDRTSINRHDGLMDDDHRGGKRNRTTTRKRVCYYFVMPASSGLAAGYPGIADKLPFYLALKSIRDHLKKTRAAIKEEESNDDDWFKRERQALSKYQAKLREELNARRLERDDKKRRKRAGLAKGRGGLTGSLRIDDDDDQRRQRQQQRAIKTKLKIDNEPDDDDEWSRVQVASFKVPFVVVANRHANNKAQRVIDVDDDDPEPSEPMMMMVQLDQFNSCDDNESSIQHHRHLPQDCGGADRKAGEEGRGGKLHHRQDQQSRISSNAQSASFSSSSSRSCSSSGLTAAGRQQAQTCQRNKSALMMTVINNSNKQRKREPLKVSDEISGSNYEEEGEGEDEEGRAPWRRRRRERVVAASVNETNHHHHHDGIGIGLNQEDPSPEICNSSSSLSSSASSASASAAFASSSSSSSLKSTSTTNCSISPYFS